MRTAGQVNQTAHGRPARRPLSGLLAGLARGALRAPFSARSRRELLFCVIEAPLGLSVLAVPIAFAGAQLVVMRLAKGTRRQDGAHPADIAVAVTMSGILLLVVTLAPRAARGLGAVHRKLAASLLGELVTKPQPVRGARGAARRRYATLRDGPGWRAVAYLVLKLPVTVGELYAVALAALGLASLSYPFWWQLFRNHPAGVHLRPVTVLTTLGAFDVTTFPGTFAAFAAGAGMLLAAPWVARAAAKADCWLMRGLLSPGRLVQRVADLEQTRALAVEDAAALLRRLERDLHDGAQIRLATLAMNLGMAKEKLAAEGDPVVRELVDAAHRGAKDALTELRDLARGIHPAALDNGLADALATLAAANAVPAELTTDIPQRPAPAVETIAYFCAAELMANAAKHSGASKITVDVTGHGAALVLRVSDTGRGGADPAAGTGLSGLAQRVRTVDGQMRIVSPPGGPTQVTITLPLRVCGRRP